MGAVATLLVLAHLLTAGPAAAQSQGTDRVLAESLFREGRELLDQDKVAEACTKFGESYRLDRALGTLLNLALCHEKEGRTATAWAEFTEAAAEAVAEKDDREAFAKKHVAALAPELQRVRLVVTPSASALSSLEIRLDGNRLGRGVWESAVPLDPGYHDLSASADGKKPYRVTFTVPKGAGITNVTVPALEDAPVPTPAPKVEASTSNGGKTQRWFGYVMSGVGIAGLAVGGGFGLRALALKDQRDSHCAADRLCDPTGVAKDGNARDAALISTIGVVGGAALLTAGIVLVLTAPKSTVRVGTSGRDLVVGGTF